LRICIWRIKFSFAHKKMGMIFYNRWLKTQYPIDSNHYEEKLNDISGTLLLWLKECNYIEEKTGLYLATSNAGVFESISFWENALIHSPGFANPANFNWTLSNGPASLLSRTLQIRGPCYTLIGNSQAIEGCLYHAVEDFKAGTITTALVSGLDIINKELHFCVCLLSALPGKNIPDLKSIQSNVNEEKYASFFLNRILTLLS
jgi:hypothetical protein